MNRFLQLLLALVALLAGFLLIYDGYGRGVSLAGKTSTGFAQLKTGLDGHIRVPLHHWEYAAGFLLIVGSIWWLVHGSKAKPVRRRR